MNYTAADEGCERCANLTTKGLWRCAFCGRVIDNRSAFSALEGSSRALPENHRRRGPARPDSGLHRTCHVGSHLVRHLGVRLSAVLIMLFAGSGGAAVQAHFLGGDSAIGKPDRTGDDLFAKQPFVFGAPWVLASVLAAALFIK